jgi:hypothetical protein
VAGVLNFGVTLRVVILSENRQPLFGIVYFRCGVILSENRQPLFGITYFRCGVILSENRQPLFGITPYIILN